MNLAALKLMPFIIGFLICIQLNGQDMDKHLWENRILIVKTNAPELEEYKKLVENIANFKSEFVERKLLLYQIVDEAFEFHDFAKEKKVVLGELANGFDFLNPSQNFEIILIGLDGGIKMRSSEVVNLNSIFKKIDSMPMRRYELSKN